MIATTAAVLLLAGCGASQDKSASQTSSPGVTYKSCAEAQAAGKAPLHKGDPGYSTALDRDGDGTACETEASPTPTGPPAARQYGTAEQLRDATVEWGMTCDKWDGSGASDLTAAQSGVCTATVGEASALFATYATPADLQTDLTYLRGLIVPGEDVALLVGPNWLISTDGAWAARLQAKLGGTIAR
jgi:hypothetical protein